MTEQDIERAYSSVLAARSAAIKAQKAYHDAVETFHRLVVKKVDKRVDAPVSEPIVLFTL